MDRSEELYRRALGHLPGGNSRSTLFLAPHPPYAARGEGCELTDVDGHRLIDLQNNYTALLHGHAFAPVIAAAGAAIAAGSAYGLPTLAEIELAECLADRVGWATSWRFANSGSEAVMMAVRAARAGTGRSGLIRFAGCYHGSWDAVAAPGAPGVPAATRSEVVTLALGDAPGLLAALDRHEGTVAAVLLDAMPNQAGLVPLERSFVQLVREQTRRRGIALVLDEVIGFRVARGGLHSTYGIQGDLIALGKAIGGGFPVGAIGGREELMEVFDPRRAEPVAHGGTFSANPVSMSAGLAALRHFEQDRIERIDALGDLLRAGLRERGWLVGGRGSLLRVRSPAGEWGAELWWRLYRAGVLVAGSGLVCTSTAMDERTIERALAAFDRAVAEDR
ncbi:MAG TPA: aminotransferase class III-fold pyridoxal phosphate-dependent enzyme [Solirubrobacteraceae bacterium]|nr:aminotransferase class III-fold pyridoxal phosphate-dependent enzyme [Solirubrobacteraceae bacterium]